MSGWIVLSFTCEENAKAEVISEEWWVCLSTCWVWGSCVIFRRRCQTGIWSHRSEAQIRGYRCGGHLPIGDSWNHGNGWDSWAGVLAQNRKGQTLASQIFPSLLSAPPNSLNRQESQKPSTIESANDPASLISLAFLLTKTARENRPCIVYLSQSVRLMFIPDVTDIGESVHPMGPYRSRQQTPLAYPNTCYQPFWQNSQEEKTGMCEECFTGDAQQKPAVSLMIICIHTEICSTKEFTLRRNSSLVIHTTVPQSVFIIYCTSALGLFKAQHVIQSFYEYIKVESSSIVKDTGS